MRKNIFSRSVHKEISNTIKQLKSCNYDYIIDAQGLIKSALVTSLAKGTKSGLDKNSCKEPLATLFYKNTAAISKKAHAIERVRMLFSEILAYKYDPNTLDYGLTESLNNSNYNKPYLVFLHATSGDYKLWPVEQWVSLRNTALENGFSVYLPWGSETERLRAEAIANDTENCHVLPKMNLTEIAALLASAAGVVGVDTGLAHLAAALSVPGVTIYVDTYPKLTGACGLNQICLSKEKLAQDSSLSTTGLESIYSEHLLASDVWGCLTKNMHR